MSERDDEIREPTQMPVHDWSRARAGKFHHFHNSWIYKLSDRLNAGLLPPGFYAAGEQVAGEIEPDVLTLQQKESAELPWHEAVGVVAVEEHPPQVSYTFSAEEAIYLRKQDRLTIRAPDDRLVAIIEITSRGNKASRNELDRFLRKVASALDGGIHLLVVDLHPPGPYDPSGIHGAVWEHLFGQCPAAPADRPLTLVAYRAAPVTAYVEPVAIGAALPKMPLFLDTAWYIRVPLEESYMETWDGLPEPCKRELTE
jgi:hypothetical protein